VQTLADRASDALATRRFEAAALAFFGAAALLLAALGLYGVASHAVARRSTELAIRLALGASPRSLLGAVLRENGYVTLAGGAAGVALAVAAVRLLRARIADAAALDPWTLVGIAVVLALAGLCGSWRPAVRAAHADPRTTLRES
jgi:ABC-type antimicrobial peptide transport system permease subunit